MLSTVTSGCGADSQELGNRLPCDLGHTPVYGNLSNLSLELALRGTLMSTPEEYWYRAEALVKLAAAATQLYAREMLLERAAEFRQMAAHLATAGLPRGPTMSERGNISGLK